MEISGVVFCILSGALSLDRSIQMQSRHILIGGINVIQLKYIHIFSWCEMHVNGRHKGSVSVSISPSVTDTWNLSLISIFLSVCLSFCFTHPLILSLSLSLTLTHTLTHSHTQTTSSSLLLSIKCRHSRNPSAWHFSPRLVSAGLISVSPPQTTSPPFKPWGRTSARLAQLEQGKLTKQPTQPKLHSASSLDKSP